MKEMLFRVFEAQESVENFLWTRHDVKDKLPWCENDFKFDDMHEKDHHDVTIYIVTTWRLFGSQYYYARTEDTAVLF